MHLGVFFTTPPPALELNTSICDQRVPNNLRCKRWFPIGDAKIITFRGGSSFFGGGGSLNESPTFPPVRTQKNHFRCGLAPRFGCLRCESTCRTVTCKSTTRAKNVRDKSPQRDVGALEARYWVEFVAQQKLGQMAKFPQSFSPKIQLRNPHCPSAGPGHWHTYAYHSNFLDYASPQCGEWTSVTSTTKITPNNLGESMSVISRKMHLWSWPSQARIAPSSTENYFVWIV